MTKFNKATITNEMNRQRELHNMMHDNETYKAASETVEAYGDCNDYETKSRNLDYRSDVPLTFELWCNVMELACRHYGEGLKAFAYNSFGVPSIREHVGAIVDQLDDDEREALQFFAAREGSVCLYVNGNAGTLRDLADAFRECHADELTFELSETFTCNFGNVHNKSDWELNVDDPKSPKVLRVWWD